MFSEVTEINCININTVIVVIVIDNRGNCDNVKFDVLKKYVMHTDNMIRLFFVVHGVVIMMFNCIRGIVN